MANPELERRARVIFRSVLNEHYQVGTETGPRVSAWLRIHGGWFSTPYVDVNGRLPEQVDEGEMANSPDPDMAMITANLEMEFLERSAGFHEQQMEIIWSWLRDYAAHYEEVHFYDDGSNRIDDRTRSRSPRRIEDVLVAPGLLNGRNDTIQGLAERRNDTIERLTPHRFTGMAYKFSVELDSWVKVEV